MAKINDFGKKIGGARKDMWAGRNLIVEDLLTMNDAEMAKYCIKDNIWPKINAEEAIKNGEDRFICFWKSEQRKAVSNKPKDTDYDNYVHAVGKARDLVMVVQNKNDIDNFYYEITRLMCRGRFIKSEFNAIRPKFFNSGNPYQLQKMEEKMIKEQFGIPKEERAEELFNRTYKIYKVDHESVMLDTSDTTRTYIKVRIGSLYGNSYGWSFYHLSNELPTEVEYTLVDKLSKKAYLFETKEEAEELLSKFHDNVGKNTNTTSQKKGKSGKKKFKPVIFENVEYEGENYCSNPTEKDWMETFAPYGCEFGNWLSQKDREYSMLYAFNSLCNMADVLGIETKDIFFNGKLSLAFGARGIKSAAAHYEPERRVINLTKLHGAGSLAHEWGHALDHEIALFFDFRDKGTKFMSDSFYKNKYEIFKNLVDTMVYKGNGYTDFYNNSVKFDKMYTKEEHGYWSSRKELFARAFSCYIADRTGFKDDYLFGHCESHSIDGITAYPTGEERFRINLCFDELFKFLKDEDVLHKSSGVKKEKEKKFVADSSGQLSFFF